jgi:hypothetical protein
MNADGSFAGNSTERFRTVRKSGPISKVQKIFDEVARLPRRQQDKIVEVVSALMTQYEQSR